MVWWVKHNFCPPIAHSLVTKANTQTVTTQERIWDKILKLQSKAIWKQLGKSNKLCQFSTFHSLPFKVEICALNHKEDPNAKWKSLCGSPKAWSFKCSDLTASPREMAKSHKLPVSNFQGPFEDYNFKRDYYFIGLIGTGHYVTGPNNVHRPMCKPLQ